MGRIRLKSDASEVPARAERAEDRNHDWDPDRRALLVKELNPALQHERSSSAAIDHINRHDTQVAKNGYCSIRRVAEGKV